MIQKVAVIGSGQMGTGIAHVCALSGLDVYLLDADPETLKKALGDIEKGMGAGTTKVTATGTT